MLYNSEFIFEKIMSINPDNMSRQDIAALSINIAYMIKVLPSIIGVQFNPRTFYEFPLVQFKESETDNPWDEYLYRHDAPKECKFSFVRSY